MSAWLHFIGRQYYSRASFIREAEKYGVTRRVSLHTLARMNWGDLVALAIKESRTPVLFGTFHISRLSGLSPQASDIVRDLFRCEVIQGQERHVERECGDYYELGITVIVHEAPLPEIARALIDAKKRGIDIGKPMVGGVFQAHELVYLKDIPHQQGFRPFDWPAFVKALEWAKAIWPDGKGRRRIPVVRGQFYAQAEGARPGDGELVVVGSYRRREEKSFQDGEPRVAVEV